MRMPKLTCIAAVVAGLTASMAGQAFRVYPGAHKLVSPEMKESKEAMAALPLRVTIDSYLKDDSFEKVVAFYRTVGQEPSSSFMKRSGKLPHQLLTRSWIVFDGAADFVSSRNGAMIQYPYVPIDMNGTMQCKDICGATAIVVSQKK